MTAGTHNITGRGASNNKQPNSSGSGGPDKKSVAAFFFLPGIIPQIKELGRGGFSYLASLMAIIYRAVRILPANHPYTQPQNFGRYGLRQVIAEAANNVKMDRQHIDQVVIFFAVLSAVFILILQILSFVILVFSGEAFASGATGPDSFGGIFKTQKPETDLAFHMMREVFGIPDMFGTLTNQTAFHKALHVLLNFYNLALLLVAVLVFLYYVIVVVAETAQTGTPFGKRFSHIYAPIRLVIAIGLLVPLNYGLNGSQYITLFSAKMGSGFATTGWTQFNNALDNPAGVENATLIAQTKDPDIEGLVEYMAVAVTCKYGIEEFRPNTKIEKHCVTKKPDKPEELMPVDCNDPGTPLKDVKIMFGEIKESRPDGNGQQEPIPHCGIVVQNVTVPMESSDTAGDPGNLLKEYMNLVNLLWEMGKLKEMAQIFVDAHANGKTASTSGEGYHPPPEKKIEIYTEVRKKLKEVVQKHYDDARSNADFKMRQEVKDLGWGGAGIWYNRIAQINGAYVTATMSVPVGEKWPIVAEHVLNEKKKADSRFRGCKMFEPNLADGKDIEFTGGDGIEKKLATLFNDMYGYWTCDKRQNASNFFIDSFISIFGLNGLMSIRDSAEVTSGSGASATTKTVEIHPLAKLSALGKGLIESAIRSLGYAIGFSAVGGIVGVLSPHFGGALDAASSIFVSVASIGLSIGFLTFYVLPFLPFIYFFFAVGTWVKSIFEAMVGAPLWALAHLRIDGEGLPGKMAVKGYYLIFEIFLRPILTVFGLIGGMAIFTAMAMILNEVFDLVVINTAGVDLTKEDDQGLSRHIIDVFFFTCLYAVILYMMAVSSFKMINLVPNSILRWLGESASAFADDVPDPAGNLNQYAAIGGGRIGGQVAQAGVQLSKAGGAAAMGGLKLGKDVVTLPFGLFGRRGR
jgi:conjugal transfer/type IV secretion protein DotA/TraY